ncbi:MAG TPA: cupin domain-containing protein [Acetobacteraceae bacterium]|nr:cupin domain-containing protein [Acetobacteraceae bacterium]
MTEPEAFTFADDGAVPNSDLPMLLYRGAVPADAVAIEARFASNGWPPAWRNGVHPFHHFHSTAHEALGVARGSARVLFGGPLGQEVEVRAGDVVVLPAGTGHCALGASPDLLIVGAYPEGMAKRLDTRRARPEEIAEVRRNIAHVPADVPDPVQGAGGPLSRRWRRDAG